MANVRDIRTRIRSVRNTQQVTKAMKMVAAAKLRRAQDRIIAARPYADQILEVLRSLAARANPDTHPLLATRGAERLELVIITADKGLCGGFNTNIIKKATAFIQQQGARVLTTHLIGRKGRDYFKKRSYDVTGEYIDLFRNLSYDDGARIAQDIMKRYIECDLDAVYLVYNEFKSVIRQEVVIEQPPAAAAPGAIRDAGSGRTTSTSRRHRRCSTCCSPSTWSSRCCGRCTNRPRRSSARGCRPWTRPRETPTR